MLGHISQLVLTRRLIYRVEAARGCEQTGIVPRVAWRPRLPKGTFRACVAPASSLIYLIYRDAPARLMGGLLRQSGSI